MSKVEYAPELVVEPGAMLVVGKALGLSVGARVEVFGSSDPVGAARETIGVLVATVLVLSRTNMPL